MQSTCKGVLRSTTPHPVTSLLTIPHLLQGCGVVLPVRKGACITMRLSGLTRVLAALPLLISETSYIERVVALEHCSDAGAILRLPRLRLHNTSHHIARISPALVTLVVLGGCRQARSQHDVNFHIPRTHVVVPPALQGRKAASLSQAPHRADWRTASETAHRFVNTTGGTKRANSHGTSPLCLAVFTLNRAAV